MGWGARRGKIRRKRGDSTSRVNCRRACRREKKEENNGGDKMRRKEREGMLYQLEEEVEK